MWTIIAIGCGHTNNLRYFDLKDQAADYDYYAKADGAEAYAVLPITHYSHDSHNRHHHRDGDVIIEIIGEGVLTSELQGKLRRAADPDKMASAVSEGVESKLVTYQGLKNAPDSVKPVYLIETVLKKYRLESSSWESNVNIRAETRIIHQPSGKIVWDDEEYESIPLQHTPLGGLAPNPISTVVGVLNATAILAMSDEELRSVLTLAAEEVGRKIAETFREDVSETR